MKKISIVSFLIVVIIAAGCSNNNKKSIANGLIEYSISYPDAKTDDSFMTSMMPQKMILHFNGISTRSDLTMGMGIMKAAFISDAAQHKLTTLLQIMDKKYALVLDSVKLNQELQQKEQWTFNASDDNKNIAGYTCQKWEGKGSQGNHMDIWTTSEIAIQEPNWSTPMKAVTGVMLQYDLIVNKIHMRLLATKVESATIDAAAFSVPKEYPIVTKQEMPEIFSQFFQ